MQDEKISARQLGKIDLLGNSKRPQGEKDADPEDQPEDRHGGPTARQSDHRLPDVTIRRNLEAGWLQSPTPGQPIDEQHGGQGQDRGCNGSEQIHGVRRRILLQPSCLISPCYAQREARR